MAKEYPQKSIYVTFSSYKKHMDISKAYLKPRCVPTFPLVEEPFKKLSILVRCGKVLDRPQGECAPKSLIPAIKKADWASHDGHKGRHQELSVH